MQMMNPSSPTCHAANLGSLLLFIPRWGQPKTGSSQKGSKLTPASNEVPTVLTLDELKEKTNNFGSKSLIGEGRYASVYSGKLDSGKAVAIKKLDPSSISDF
ncbi:hypothetical protein IFM89_024564 [Coptis chinensis]|uniref:Protein kinase domain-containing protein n=1 Tax=Coptis chinensis TaxID=261450 RepID=A0A835I595_9MAGN|nr:hypothetical protein IFM89_024564 [Coptis chinensis]